MAHALERVDQSEVEAGPAVDVVMTVADRNHRVAARTSLDAIVARTIEEGVGAVAAGQPVVALRRPPAYRNRASRSAASPAELSESLPPPPLISTDD